MSARKHMPDVERILFSPIFAEPGKAFTNVIALNVTTHKHWFLNHAQYMCRALKMLNDFGYDKALFMDCDTYMLLPVYELFYMLDFYDLMGAHAPGRRTTATIEDVPLSFPELNIGVNPMLTRDNVRFFFVDVLNQYTKHKDEYRNNDQGALRDTLWNYARARRDFRFYVLPPEYNLRYEFPCFVSKEVKILHGHKEVIKVAERVNKSKEMRSWKRGQLTE